VLGGVTEQHTVSECSFGVAAQGFRDDAPQSVGLDALDVLRPETRVGGVPDHEQQSRNADLWRHDDVEPVRVDGTDAFGLGEQSVAVVRRLDVDEVAVLQERQLSRCQRDDVAGPGVLLKLDHSASRIALRP
jgi:hypothetical protein